MNDLTNIIENPILREFNKRQRLAINTRFPELSNCEHNNYLLLKKYLSNIPHCFFLEPIYADFISWLKERDNTSRSALQGYLESNSAELNRSLLHLEEINKLNYHDHFELLDDYAMIRFIDKEIHPCYLRLTEAVFAPVCKIIAYFSRIDRGKGIDDLNDLWPIIQEIKVSSLNKIIEPYNHLIRNGIAHGGITYFQKEIQYRDKKGNEEKISDSEIIRFFDNLLDTCNSLVLALSVFLLVFQPKGYKLLQQLLLDELIEETSTPWWKIVGCTPSSFSGINQLIIYARPQTSDYRKVQMSTFQSGLLAEKSSPGYDRYFFSIRSENSLPGWASFDGIKLRQLRENKIGNLNDYKDVIHDNLIFFVPRLKLPNFLYKIHSFILSFKVNWPIFIEDFKKRIGQPAIYIRDSKIHRNSWGCVLNGNVYIDNYETKITQNTIKRIKRVILKKSLSEARNKLSIYNFTRFLPLGFALISVYRKNSRRRQFYGLNDNLICTIQVKHIKRIRCPDIIGSTVEQIGKYRIAWNRAWIENFQ